MFGVLDSRSERQLNSLHITAGTKMATTKRIKLIVIGLVIFIFITICFWKEKPVLVGSQSHAVAVPFEPTPLAVSVTQLRKSPIPSSPPCGKICSYEWDAREEGKFYPLLHKAVNCPNIIYRMAHSPHPVVLPPPRRPPPQLLRNFTIDGQCPLTVHIYYDNSKTTARMRVSAKMFRRLLELDNVTNINHYHDKNVLKPALIKYKHLITEKRVAVVGTEKPWAEAMLLNLGAINVTTIEYRKLIIEDERVTTITPYRLAEQFISGRGAPFDTVFTYSSLEHSGLGRYGDPITPFGDMEATAQVWCMVKPGGHFILAVPVSVDRDKCSVMWNGCYVYGAVRLQHLTANWRVLDEFAALDLSKHRIYVLQKVDAV